MRSSQLAVLALGAVLAPLSGALAQPGTVLPNMRPYDQTGVNVFEPRKDTAVNQGPALKWGVGFTQQFQALDHENNNPDDVAARRLIQIQSGFNLAQANLMLDAQLAPGVRVNLTTYLSTRHHNETWVKGGYVQVDDASFPGVPALDRIMDNVTVKMGHFEINYGDAHFRRTDGGHAMYNPFVGNLIMDSFTTEIGAEVYAHAGPLMAMVGVTGGEIQGGSTVPLEAGTPNRDARAPSFLGKLAYDQQFTPDLRARLSGSVYTTSSSARNTLYGGDRAGSRFYLVLEPTTATAAANFTSGRINPGLTDQITAIQVNPFVKFRGLELFGTIEQAQGRAFNEDVRRSWTQLAGDVIYRFLPREQAYVGVHYNTVTGPLAGPVVAGRIPAEGQEVTIDRFEIGAGWYTLKNLLLKGSYVQQNYRDFPATDIRNGGRFSGIMIEGVLAF